DGARCSFPGGRAAISFRTAELYRRGGGERGGRTVQFWCAGRGWLFDRQPTNVLDGVVPVSGGYAATPFPLVGSPHVHAICTRPLSDPPIVRRILLQTRVSAIKTARSY